MDKTKKIINNVIIIIVIQYLVHSLVISFFFVPQIAKKVKENQSHFSVFLADADLLSQSPIFPSQPRNKNAEALMSEYISFKKFSGGGIEAPKNSQALSDLFNENKDWSKNRDNFNKLMNDPRLMKIDTSWMERLSGFNYWDYGLKEDIQDQIESVAAMNSMARVSSIREMNEPDYATLNNWIAAFVMKANLEQRPLEGLRVARHIAYLVHSTGTSLVSNAYVAMMLRRESIFTQQLNINNWVLIPEENIKAYKRLTTVGWPLILHDGWFNKLDERFTPYMTAENGICSSVLELYVNSPLAFYDYFQPEFVAEYDSSVYLAKADIIQSQIGGQCKIRSLRPLMKQVNLDDVRYDSSMGSSVPFYRKIIGMWFLYSSAPVFRETK